MRRQHFFPQNFLSATFFFAILNSSFVVAQDEIITKNIAFTGNSSFSQNILKSKMTLRAKTFFRSLQFWNSDNRPFEYSEFILKRDLNRIMAFYNTEGFLKAKVDTYFVALNEENSAANLTIRLTEGDSVTIRKLSFELNARDDFDRERCGKILKNLKTRFQLQTGNRYRDAALQADTDLIYRDIANAGYPYVTVLPKPLLSNGKNALDLTLIVNPGPHCVFGDIEVIGNERVPASAVIKQLSFRKGEVFNQDAVRKSQAQIYQLGIFQFVTIQLLFGDSLSQKLPVRIKLKEGPTLTTKLGLGFGREDRIRVSADSQILGLGGARRLNLLLKASKLEPINVNLTMTQPAFPDRLSILAINPFYRRQKEPAFDVKRIGANLAVQRKMGIYTNGFINYTFENTEEKNGNQSNSNNKSLISFGMIRNSSTPLFSPTQGTVRSVTITLSGLGFNSVQFVRFVGEHIKYWRLADVLVFAHKFKIGWMETYGGGTHIPKEDRFYAGGSNSVRGWRRQELGSLDDNDIPIGGNMLLDASLEIRYPFWGLLSGVNFIDFGNVWNDKISGVRYAFGIGLRFETVIGPARLDLGIPTFEDKRVFEWQDKQFHISVGHAF
ncbi:MAG: outer membrane protein assembly factor [bacterium]